MNNHKWKATNSVLFIIFLTFIFLVISLKVQDIGISLAIAELDSKYISKQMELNEKLIRENAELRDKLENSNKIETPETTKKLMQFYIQKYFPESEWEKATKISTCESNMNPQTINTKNRNGTVDRGAWQINTVHKERFSKMYGIDWEVGAHDPDLSTKYAKFLYDNSGFNPWICSKLI